ncbi:nephrocystin-3 [Olea europaea var. sylvestris]|uniref:nephrocystin-3 n=1 Tax=Olea europaea var. sylvestris TaxID=158386 RepID=UPI000C1D3C39|nr:nephrocystin-3 [Olea europaea var. sylvestris]
MAASLYTLSIAVTLRMNLVHPKNHLYLPQLRKGVVRFRARTSITWQKCNLKLKMVPGGLFSGCCDSRTLATANSLEIDGENQANGFRSRYLNENSMNFQNSMNDLESQLQELFNEVRTMIQLGKENDAVDLLEANYEAVKEQMASGATGIEEAAILDVIALGYMVIGDLQTVGSILDVLNKIVNRLKDQEPLLDSILMHMGSMYDKLEKFELSIGFYQRSLQIMERTYGNNSSFLTMLLLGMAKVLGSMGRASEAMETYQRVITLLESSRGGENEELAVPLLALGNLLVKEGRAPDAESPFNRILIYVNTYGEKDGRVGLAMCSLAQVKCAKGDVNEAIDLYKKALQILEDSKYMELDDIAMEQMRVDLAELLHATGRGEEGRAILEKCLLINEKYKGKEHPSSVPLLVNLATSYSRYKNFVEAERLLSISLQIMMKTVPPDDQSLTFPMLHLAITLYNLNRDEEAEKLALDVLRIREKAFGRESLPTGEALDCLVSIRSRSGKDDSELLELLKRVLRIQEKAFGHEGEEVMETLKKIVCSMDKMGMNNEKRPLQRRLSILRKKHKKMVRY